MMNTDQIEMVSIEQLIPEKHTYRRLKKLLNFDRIVKSVKIKTYELGADGYEKLHDF